MNGEGVFKKHMREIMGEAEGDFQKPKVCLHKASWKFGFSAKELIGFWKIWQLQKQPGGSFGPFHTHKTDKIATNKVYFHITYAY